MQNATPACSICPATSWSAGAPWANAGASAPGSGPWAAPSAGLLPPPPFLFPSWQQPDAQAPWWGSGDALVVRPADAEQWKGTFTRGELAAALAQDAPPTDPRVCPMRNMRRQHAWWQQQQQQQQNGPQMSWAGSMPAPAPVFMGAAPGNAITSAGAGANIGAPTLMCFAIPPEASPVDDRVTILPYPYPMAGAGSVAQNGWASGTASPQYGGNNAQFPAGAYKNGAQFGPATGNGNGNGGNKWSWPIGRNGKNGNGSAPHLIGGNGGVQRDGNGIGNGNGVGNGNGNGGAYNSIGGNGAGVSSQTDSSGDMQPAGQGAGIPTDMRAQWSNLASAAQALGLNPGQTAHMLGALGGGGSGGGAPTLG